MGIHNELKVNWTGPSIPGGPVIKIIDPAQDITIENDEDLFGDPHAIMEPPSVSSDQTLEITIGPHTHQRTEGTTKRITTHTTFYECDDYSYSHSYSRGRTNV